MAAAGGHIEVLKWLIETGCSLHDGIWFGASQGGHLDMLKWMKENGKTWDSIHTPGIACEQAGAAGHQEVLKWWLIENGSSCWEQTCDAAAKAGHLDILTWAVNNTNTDVDWSRIGQGGLRGGKLNIVRWLVAEGHPVPWTKLAQGEQERGKISFKLELFLKRKGLITF